MKPSELIKPKLNLDEDDREFHKGEYTIIAQYIRDKDFEELDKRFIDREELKKQINKLFFDLRQTIPKEKMKPNKKEILAIESLFYIQGEILELLK